MASSQQAKSQAFIDELLKQISDELFALGYTDIHHARLSYESCETDENVIAKDQQAENYQGLTRACYDKNKCMLKWELLTLSHNAQSTLSLEKEVHQQIIEDVTQLESIKEIVLNQKSEPAPTVVVPIINSQDNKSLTFQNKKWLFSWIAMPYLELGSVRSYIKHHKNSLSHLTQTDIKQRLAIIYAMAHNIRQLHQAGWMHGDIKPSNFLLVNNEQSNAKSPLTFSVCLSDFANAQNIETHNQNQREGQFAKRLNQLSSTPAYLAPECWHGERITIQSDIYAFGITVFEVLAGYRPYQVGNFNRVKSGDKMKYWAVHHCQTPIPLLPSAWQDFQPLVDKLMAKSIHNRFNNMQQVCEALEYYR